jgi:hypothetical protein
MNDKQKQHLAPGSDYLLSLSSVVGKSVKDVHGYVSHQFGEPVFKVSKVVFDDDTEETLGGEHDIAYIDSENHPELGDDKLNAIEPEEGDDDEEEDDIADDYTDAEVSRLPPSDGD